MKLLALFAGAICKLYDDMNDNNLYNHEYINEILKGLHFIAFTILSLSSGLFYAYLMFFHSLTILYDPVAFSQPYEFGGFLSAWILVFFVEYPKLYPVDITFFFFVCLFLCSVDVKLGEFGITKCIIRAVGVIFVFLVLCLNSRSAILSHGIELFLYYALGYGMVSVVFQLTMLSSNNSLVYNFLQFW